MKTKKTMTKLVAGAAIALASIAPSYGQLTIGSKCGCPPIASRPSVTLSTLPGNTAVSGTNGFELTNGAVLTCDKTYIIDAKIYVPSGQVLTIEPGTVIKGLPVVNPVNATALVVERGGKINAEGTKDCPIVFTSSLDDMSTVFSATNTSKWGGIVILGKATNNLTTANTSGVGVSANGVGRIEGFNTSISQDRFGVLQNGSLSGETIGQFDDNDNSGVMTYCSIRHSGAILSVGNEINGLSLGSVGRGTKLEHIEIVSCGDDGIEFFGGTVDIKYITMLFGNDDMFDWDLGWSGRAQFLFGMKSDNTFGVDSDNGFEMDSDDGKTNALPRAHPIIANATIVGNSKFTPTSDNSAMAAINAKELTEGEIYNSVFANFRNGLNLQVSIGSRVSSTLTVGGAGEAYNNWSVANGNTITPQSLKVKCNTFVNVTGTLSANPTTSAVVGSAITNPADINQFTVTDMNTFYSGNSLPGFNYNYTFVVGNGVNVADFYSVKNDVVPNPALSISGCPALPNNGFFSPAAYRGAFGSTAESWLSDWSYSSVLKTTVGASGCITDLNKDGQTDTNDFLIFAPAFGTPCQ